MSDRHPDKEGKVNVDYSLQLSKRECSTEDIKSFFFFLVKDE